MGYLVREARPLVQQLIVGALRLAGVDPQQIDITAHLVCADNDNAND